MAPNGTDNTTQQFSPDQSQYIPPLETWPPQGPSAYSHHMHADDIKPPPAPELPSVTLPWIFVALGLLIPLSALIVGIWSLTRTHSDNRYVTLAFAGFGVFALMIVLNLGAIGML